MEGLPETNGDVSPRAATFAGRLKIQDFAFRGEAPVPSPAASPIRRSARLSTTTDAAGTTTTTTTTTSLSHSPHWTTSTKPPLKRKGGSSSSTSSSAPPKLSPSPRRRRQPSASPGKKAQAQARARARTGYAPPSTYAHLPYLPDAIGERDLVLLVGLNPGVETARTGHAYAHPSNLFWRLLEGGGLTPRRVHFSEDRSLPRLFGLGLTNIVARPSRSGAELSRAEMDAGVAALEAKAARHRPEVVCLVGKSIWESVWRVRRGRPLRPADGFRYGWQDEADNMGVVRAGADGAPGWAGARVFVATSTSGLAASLSPAEKLRVWRELGAWVEKRRAERAAEEEGGGDGHGRSNAEGT